MIIDYFFLGVSLVIRAVAHVQDNIFGLLPAVPAWIVTSCEQIGNNGAFLLSTLGSAGADLAGVLAWALQLVVAVLPFVITFKLIQLFRAKPTTDV